MYVFLIEIIKGWKQGVKYERTTVELYFKDEDGDGYLILDDFVDKEIKE